MPFQLIKKNGGFFVKNPDTNKLFSKTPLHKEDAKKQRIALAIASSKNERRPINKFFI